MAKRKPGRRGDWMLVGRAAAGTELIARTGATGFEISYDDDVPGDATRVDWTAQAKYRGTRVISQRFPYPAQAVEDLLSRVLNGGLCQRCHRRTVVGILHDDYCCFSLLAMDLDDPGSYRYVRSCEVDEELRRD